MKKCIVCGKEVGPEFYCRKKEMKISLCEQHKKSCIKCDHVECGLEKEMGNIFNK